MKMENVPQLKPEEEYPLLRVEAGGGDGKVRKSVPVNNEPSGWSVRCTPKQSWCNRWPEFVSAFWMTLVLLTISFLVFYALGMSVYRRQPVIVVRYNNTKLGSDVFYHHIIKQDALVPFSLFSHYLSFMARQYPALRFTVYFLIDDSCHPFHGPRHPKSRLLKKFIPHITSPFNTVFNQKRDIKDFQKRYQNVNVCIMLLSKYMAMTPLKYKWKTIPQNHLSFYARIHEIQQNGGIGFDLISFNNQFNNNIELDKRIDGILKNYNNGIEPEKYEDILNSLEDEQQNELFSMFFNYINSIFNEARLFLDIDWNTNVTVLDNKPKIRTHRSKREVKDVLHVYNITSKNDSLSTNHTEITMEAIQKINVSTNNETFLHKKTFMNNSFPTKTNILESKNKYVPTILFYNDVSGFYGDVGPLYYTHNTIAQPNIISNRILRNDNSMDNDDKISNLLLLSPEGHFVATSSRLHPFLTQILSSSCFRLNPKTAIKDTLFTQCSGFLRDDIYCKNIRLIYNAI